MIYKIIVIGTSAGGIDALKLLFARLNPRIQQPIVIIQHLEPRSNSYLADIIENISSKICYEAEDKMVIDDGKIYVPAPNYHLLMEKDWTLSLNTGERVCYARPSIDVFFECVADAVKSGVIGVVLTGANSDGANGLKAIKNNGGYTIVQLPEEAYASQMPTKAIQICGPKEILSINTIANRINELTMI